MPYGRQAPVRARGAGQDEPASGRPRTEEARQGRDGAALGELLLGQQRPSSSRDRFFDMPTPGRGCSVDPRDAHHTPGGLPSACPRRERSDQESQEPRQPEVSKEADEPRKAPARAAPRRRPGPEVRAPPGTCERDTRRPAFPTLTTTRSSHRPFLGTHPGWERMPMPMPRQMGRRPGRTCPDDDAAEAGPCDQMRPCPVAPSAPHVPPSPSPVPAGCPPPMPSAVAVITRARPPPPPPRR